MLPIPAIDLKDGQCVRLRQGKMDDATVFSSEPLVMAEKWIAQGARRLHIVDLNGAFAGSPQNARAVREIVSNFPEIAVQIGGGIRDLQTAQYYFDLGVSFCIIGSKAVSDAQFVKQLSAQFPQQIILGIDAKDGKVAVDGWAQLSAMDVFELANHFNESALAAIIYTDISKDGMMGGVNVTQTAKLAASTKIPIIASGGVASLQDIHALKAASENIAAVIIGRALYDGAFTLQEAFAAAKI